MLEDYSAPPRQTISCPACGSRGNCIPHAGYRRSLIDLEGGAVVYTSLEVKRVCCGSCGHIHAVLPDFIIPYTTYSLLFILQVPVRSVLRWDGSTLTTQYHFRSAVDYYDFLLL